MPRASTATKVTAAIVLAFGPVASGGDIPTTESNFRYRLERGDIGGADGMLAEPGESRRALRITGGEQLLRACLDDPEHWRKDPLLFRFGHRRPGSTIGCRERSSPSMHVVFYRRPDGAREAWIHFDLHGPRNPLAHLSEVLRNRMTFGRTSEHEVYRGLVRMNPAAGASVPERRYDFGAHGRQYLHRAFGVKAFGTAMASAAAGFTVLDATGWGTGGGRLVDRASTNLVRNAVAQSIEFGAAAFVQQEQNFTQSGERWFSRRLRSAFYRTVVVPGRQGYELAFPRIAVALGTPWAMRHWHPGRPAPPNPWVASASLFGRYVLRSCWAEFRPDVKRGLRNLLH